MKNHGQKKTKATSTIEYVILIVAFIAALIAMRTQIARTFMGRWKTLGDTFSQGRQYDPHRTWECGRYVPRNSQDTGWDQEIWYEELCYQCCMETQLNNCKPPDTTFQGSLGKTGEGCRNPDLTKNEKRECCARGCGTNICE